MLTMTPSALAVVRKVTAHPRIGKNSGLRIAASEASEASLRVGAATGPGPEDEVVERDGARIFLGPAAVRRLRGRLLHALRERSGRVHFVVKEPR